MEQLGGGGVEVRNKKKNSSYIQVLVKKDKDR